MISVAQAAVVDSTARTGAILAAVVADAARNLRTAAVGGMTAPADAVVVLAQRAAMGRVAIAPAKRGAMMAPTMALAGAVAGRREPAWRATAADLAAA
jgi:hypothetical protein